eukprot:6484439-Prymnesium_polylepis.1
MRRLNRLPIARCVVRGRALFSSHPPTRVDRWCADLHIFTARHRHSRARVPTGREALEPAIRVRRRETPKGPGGEIAGGFGPFPRRHTGRDA